MSQQPRINGAALDAASTQMVHRELNPTLIRDESKEMDTPPMIYDNQWEQFASEPPPQTSRKDHFYANFPGLGNQVNSPHEGLGA
jgi:hypothetical protein